MSQRRGHLVTQDLKSETKLSSRFAIFAKDVVFLLLFLGIIYMFQEMVASKLLGLYWTFSIALGIILIVPSKSNPKRKNYQMLMIFLQKDETVYKSVQMKKGNDDMNKKTQKELMTTAKRMDIVRYDETHECFEQKNGYMDIVQVISKDIVNASEDTIEFDIGKLVKFNKLNYGDYKIISLNFPCNTVKQQDYLKKKIENTNNPIYQKHLKNRMYELEWIQEKRSKREYYYMIFADTIDELKKMEADMISALQPMEKMIEKMPQEKKELILFRYNNPASILTGGV